MIVHILNGDALAEKFPKEAIEGELIVFRECLVEGPLKEDTLEAFWQARSGFIGKTYGETEEGYFLKVVEEVSRLGHVPAGSEVNLWFEHDLFCQVNTWFLLALLEGKEDNLLINRVMPFVEDSNDPWQGFGPADGAGLVSAYWHRVPLTRHDIQLGKSLWEAYRRNDLEYLESLAARKPDAFPYLPEVVKAHVERYPAAGRKARPVSVLEHIVGGGTTEFADIYREFFKREGVYGFGDSQVRNLLAQVSM